jgi:small-conductance mechanosensitive channel
MTQTADSLRPQLAAVKSQIEKLGPAPGKDGPSEPPETAAERSRLATQAATYDGGIKASEVNWVRARQLIGEIAERRYAFFTKNLMQRRPGDARLAWSSPVRRACLPPRPGPSTGKGRREKRPASPCCSTAPRSSVVLRLALRKTSRRHTGASRRCPTFFRAGRLGFGWQVPSPVLIAGFVLTSAWTPLVHRNKWGRWSPTFPELSSLSAFTAGGRRAAPPRRSGARAARDQPARRVRWLLSAIAAVYALDGVLTEVSRAFYVPIALSVAQSIAASIIFAALLIGLLLTPFVPQESEATAAVYSRHLPRWLKLPLWMVALGIVTAALMGYAALARFAAQQLLVTGIVALVGWLGYLAIRAFTREPTQQSRALGDLMEHRFGLEAPRREQLARLTEAALTLLLVICALPFLMLQWGFSSADIRDWSTSLLFGLEIGQFRISLVRILGGIVLFIALLFATRLVQRWMRERAVQSRIDPSIANSIETVVGYAGIALAALVAVSYAGFDITNLAIVAGALSLGIGFGLQSIVNNFVSGLILLIERPIKVGDRIVIGDQQGHVRRISVRATEVETFDRASVIVPNSELIMGRVVNWSHRDWRGGVSVKVGVAYDADPDQVVAILKKCAEEHPLVLPSPPPGVSLEAFGESALVFNLGFSVPDIDKAYGIQSDLRIAILKALREAGIEIPFNQLDVTLRDREAMQRYLDEIREQSSNGAGRSRDAASSQHDAVSGGPVLKKG